MIGGLSLLGHEATASFAGIGPGADARPVARQRRMPGALRSPAASAWVCRKAASRLLSGTAAAVADDTLIPDLLGCSAKGAAVISEMAAFALFFFPVKARKWYPERNFPPQFRNSLVELVGWVSLARLTLSYLLAREAANSPKVMINGGVALSW